MGLHRKKDVEVAGRPAAQASFTLSGKPDAGSILDSGRHVDRERALTGDAPRPAALAARVVDGLAPAMAVRAGPLDREEALRRTHPTVAAAGRAGFGLRARLRARSAASFAR